MPDAVVICEPRKDCADPNINRWYCMRGHGLEGQKAIPGVCPLTVCERRGANRRCWGDRCDV